jgi:hypothetical protein
VRCYRLQPASEDPQRRLTPEGQWTAPWGGGSGEVDAKPRRGVSVFPEAEGL